MKLIKSKWEWVCLAISNEQKCNFFIAEKFRRQSVGSGIFEVMRHLNFEVILNDWFDETMENASLLFMKNTNIKIGSKSNTLKKNQLYCKHKLNRLNF